MELFFGIKVVWIILFILFEKWILFYVRENSVQFGQSIQFTNIAPQFQMGQIVLTKSPATVNTGTQN